MPRRTDLQRILLIGAGPIVIGQACEFDYSGTQGAKALREEGFDVVLVNSNPATIMTDPELAARTYVEPLEWRTRRRHHRARAAARAPAHARRADGAQPRAEASRGGRARAVRRRDARGEARRRSRRPRTARSSRRRWRRSASTCPRAGVAHSVEEARAIVRGHGLPRHPATELHAGRLGRRHRVLDGRVRREGGVGARAVADARGASSRRASSGGRSSSSR